MKLMNVERIEEKPLDTFRFRFQGARESVTALFVVDVKTRGDLAAAEAQALASMKAYAAVVGADD